MCSVQSWCCALVQAFRPLGTFASQNVMRGSVLEGSFIAKLCVAGQTRGVLAVDIPENHMIERMMRVLRRKTLNEKYDEKWRKTYHVKKGEIRRLELKEAKFQIFKAQFRERMKWIYRRRARYL